MSIYAIGNGKANGELGTGSFEEKLDPVMLETIKGKTLVELKACESNALAITDTGDLLIWGRNREGTLGNGSNEKSSAFPVRVGGPLEGERVQTAAIGSNHVLAVTKRGHVYHWGKLHRVASANENREYFGLSIKMTGLAMDMEDESTARKRRLLDKSHQAYYANKGGRQGLVDLNNTNQVEEHETNMDFGNFHAYLQRTPLLIEELALSSVRISKVSAGYGFSVMVSDKGQVFTLGINEKFQLGLGHRFNQDKPQLVKSLLDVVITDVACGQQHTLAIDDEKSLWSWGLGVFGQLGHSSLRDEPVPRKLVTFTPIQTQVPIDDGDFEEPLPIDPNVVEASKSIKIIQIACGSHHSLALDTEHRIWSWGSSEYGQQGGTKNYEDLGTREGQSKEQHFYYSVPRLLTGQTTSGGINSDGLLNGQRPIKIACGNLHNIALTEDGCMWTWGWGQTGALGHGNRRFQLFPTVINLLRGEPIMCIAGGARTSFALTSGSSSSFAFDFQKFINNPQYSDLTIHVARNKSFHCHKAIVFARCEYLRACYEMGKRFASKEVKKSNDGKDCLELPKMDPLIFQGLLNYLYTDHLRTPVHLVERLGRVAAKMRLVRLVALCERFLSLEEGSQITNYNAQGQRIIGNVIVPPSEWERQLNDVIDSNLYADLNLIVSPNSPLIEVGGDSLADPNIKNNAGQLISTSPTVIQHIDTALDLKQQNQFETVFAHRIILHARCDYFSTLFQSSFMDSKGSELILNGLEKNLMISLLKFLYTNSLDDISQDNIVDLLLSSDRFLIEDLKQAIELRLEEAVDDDSVVDALLISESTQTPRLRNACFSRIISNLEAFKNSPGLAKLRDALPTTLRELDYYATKKGLISAGTLIRVR